MRSFKERIYPTWARLTAVSRKSGQKNTDRGRLLQTAMVLTAAIGVDTNLTLAYQVFALLLCLVIASRLSLRIRKANLSFTRYLPRYATAGEPFRYLIKATNLGAAVERDLNIVDNPLVIPPEYEEFLGTREPGEDSRNWWDRTIGFHRFVWLQRLKTGITTRQAKVPDVNLKATVDIEVTAAPLRRGLVTFSSLTLLSPDPFGLFYRADITPMTDHLMVLPRRYSLSRTLKMSGGRNFQPGGVNPTWSIGESDEFVSLREYREGDPIRKIHWASSAKRDKPVVKEFQDEFFVRHALILDTDTNDNQILEEAVSVAASLLVQDDFIDGLLDLIYVDDSAKIVTAGRGFSQESGQLEALATVAAKPGSIQDLANAVSHHKKLVSSCFIVFTTWDDQREELAKGLVSQGISTTVFVLCETPISDAPSWLHQLDPHNVQEGLAA